MENYSQYMKVQNDKITDIDAEVCQMSPDIISDIEEQNQMLDKIECKFDSLSNLFFSVYFNRKNSQTDVLSDSFFKFTSEISEKCSHLINDTKTYLSQRSNENSKSEEEKTYRESNSNGLDYTTYYTPKIWALRT